MSAPTVLNDNDQALAALVNLLVVLADNKWYMGLHLSEWSVGAPVLESSVACAAIAQAHMGQARVLYPLMETLPSPFSPGPPGKEGGERRRYNVASLDTPLPSWPHVVAALMVVDIAFNILLESLRDAGYEALARRVARMLEEEHFQREYAQGRVHELCAFPGGRDLLQAAVQAVLPEMLCWFGPPDEPGVERLRAEGLLRHGNTEMRQRYLDRVCPTLLDAGITLPVQRGAGGAWEYGALPWDQWNHLQRRLVNPKPVVTNRVPATTP